MQMTGSITNHQCRAHGKQLSLWRACDISMRTWEWSITAGSMVHTYNPSSAEAEKGDHGSFLATQCSHKSSYRFIERPYLKRHPTSTPGFHTHILTHVHRFPRKCAHLCAHVHTERKKKENSLVKSSEAQVATLRISTECHAYACKQKRAH